MFDRLRASVDFTSARNARSLLRAVDATDAAKQMSKGAAVGSTSVVGRTSAHAISRDLPSLPDQECRPYSCGATEDWRGVRDAVVIYLHQESTEPCVDTFAP
jgi:hypothetical protein